MVRCAISEWLQRLEQPPLPFASGRAARAAQGGPGDCTTDTSFGSGRRAAKEAGAPTSIHWL